MTGRIVFSRGAAGIWQAESGSAAKSLTSLGGGEIQHVAPQLLANDAVLLFTVRPSEWTWGRERVVAQVLSTGERKTLLEHAVDTRYVPTGHLVFLRRGLLMAVRFDLERLAVTGVPVPVLDGVAQALTSGNSADVTGAGQFSISRRGDLAYIASPVIPNPDAVFMVMNRQGQVEVLPGQAHSYRAPARLSPDGRLLAVMIHTLTETALWAMDLSRGALTKLTAGGEASWPRWTPDGQHIAIEWLKDGVPQLAWQRADGSSPPATLVPGWFAPSSWSPDGRHLAGVRDYDIWFVTVGDGEPTLARRTDSPEWEWSPEFSPDGRWMAYASNKTGRFEVYIKPVSTSAPVTVVSLEGGINPAWNPRGGELFFVEPQEREGEGYRFMAVAITEGRVSPPVRLFDVPQHLVFRCYPTRCYDVTADGQRFVAMRMLPRDPPPPVTHINLILNWAEELKAKVPVE